MHRILAFEKLLEKYPEFVEKIVLLQISVPSRTDVKEYKQLKDDTELLIGRINGRFSIPNWSPIRYIYGCLSQEQLAALYRDCAVALVTPLRDGMNLVAKEFVACQINTPGVLILSPFAGAGSTMHEALLVNPYELDEMADVLNRALNMSLEERQLRMTQLRNREQLLDVNYWMRSVFLSMGALKDGNEVSHNTIQPQMDNFNMHVSNHISRAGKLSLILDYDGTLTPPTSHPDLAILSEETIRVLQRLTCIPDINIAIISGRTLDNVKSLVGIENITYAGSHGIEILHPDGTNFVHPVPKQSEQNILSLQTRLIEEVCKEGAWVEKKGIILTYNYQDVPFVKRNYLEHQAIKIFRSYGFEPQQCALAIKCKLPNMWDQGTASIYILRTTYGVDWSERVRVIYAGNEDAMMALQGIACTFRVDPSPMVQTMADFRLSGPDEVLTMLKWVEKEMQKKLLTSNNTVCNNNVQDVSLTENTRSLIIINQNEEEKESMILLARRSKFMS